MAELGLLGERLRFWNGVVNFALIIITHGQLAELVNADIVKELTQHKSPMTAWMSLPSQSALINKIAAAFRTVS
ncbi:MAG: hypothetical protein R2688_02760 [Fimbriimonadaceae bacterium]